MKRIFLTLAAMAMFLLSAVLLGGGLSHADDPVAAEPSDIAASTASAAAIPKTVADADQTSSATAFHNSTLVSSFEGPTLNQHLFINGYARWDVPGGVVISANRVDAFVVPAGTPSVGTDASGHWAIQSQLTTVTGVKSIEVYILNGEVIGVNVDGDDNTVYPADPATYTPNPNDED